MADNRKVAEQFLQAMASRDWEAQDRLLADDFVEEYPQSGERIVGKANRRAIIENYPGGEPLDPNASGPAPKPPVIVGAGDHLTATGLVTYPNGETWHVISLVEFRDGKIAKMTDYFAAPFEAPAWRAPYVEVKRTPAGTASR
jgi:ketosteroid isomerase-like protein